MGITFLCTLRFWCCWGSWAYEKKQPQDSKWKKRANHIVSFLFNTLWQLHKMVRETVEVKTIHDAFYTRRGLMWYMTENAVSKWCCLVLENGFIKDLGKKWKNRRTLRKSAWEGIRDFVGHQWHEGTLRSDLACLRTLAMQSGEGKTTAPAGTLKLRAVVAAS